MLSHMLYCEVYYFVSISHSNAATYFKRGTDRIGGVYRKSRYVQFTDGTFSTRVAREPEEEHLGILGPVLEMEAGESVVVTVRNMADRPYSFYPHGLLFEKNQEGFLYRNPNSKFQICVAAFIVEI
jgi:hypothetical protein